MPWSPDTRCRTDVRFLVVIDTDAALGDTEASSSSQPAGHAAVPRHASGGTKTGHPLEPVGALSHFHRTQHHQEQAMPAKDFIEKFKHDPDTFDFEKFKEKMLAEIVGDDDLTSNKITELIADQKARDQRERDLKVELFDATLAKQGPPVNPTDSAAFASGTNPAPPVTDADLFG